MRHLKRLTIHAAVIAALCIIIAACASTQQQLGMPPAPTGNLGADVKAVVADVVHSNVAPTDPAAAAPVPEAQSLDPLARMLTSPKFVADAAAAEAIAGQRDPVLTQCINFQLTLGQELKAKPLITVPSITFRPALASVDTSCPLCVLAAKRQDVAALSNGLVATHLAILNTEIAAIKARAADIKQRLAIACGPLLVDETNFIGQLRAALGF